ncbi:MAG: ATP-dependent protease [Alphaproteobacteria bacterium]|nr:ATP-dependent protease [Alphaproteobacteria bacterium]
MAEESAALPAPVPVETLYRHSDLKDFPFKTTAELDEMTGVLGQDRAVGAIRFAAGMRPTGYNVFVLGPFGIGKHTIVRRVLRDLAAKEDVPSDWCYVYNFETPHKPLALKLPAGIGNVLKTALDKLIEQLRAAIPAVFDSEEYRARRQAIEGVIKTRQEETFGKVQERARAANVAIIQTPAGFAFTPMREGEVIPPEEFNAFPEDRRKEFQTNVESIQAEFTDVMQQVPLLARQAHEALSELDRQVTQAAVKLLVGDTRMQFEALPQVIDYLAAIEVDVVRNVHFFRIAPQVEGQPGMIAPMHATDDLPAFRRYKVNVLVDRAGQEGAPVIYADPPNFQRLFGRIEHVAEISNLLTDFTLIKPGALHRANGGYLIIDARKTLLEPFVWDALKHALRSKEIRIEAPTQSFGPFSTQTLSPEPIPLNIKVAIIGEPSIYYLLDQNDPDFPELFRVTADFDGDMDRTPQNKFMFAQILGSLARREGLHPLSNDAVARLSEHSARLAGDAEKMSWQVRRIGDLAREAHYFASQAGRGLIERADIEAAIEAAVARISRIRTRMQEEILRQTILIATDGEVVGQLNGLSVLELGRFAFGKPSRISARVRLGAGRVIDIEREVELGGPLHSKGVLILSGFLGARYAPDEPLSLSASLVFEQSYGGVDGDSASSAELYALLSALADAPIKQSFAVTGSVNQFGDVQAIGGVNEKIEGFFDICNKRGLTGKQGVLIPQANVKHLMLRKDVVDACKAGKFVVYPIATIDQGIELLTGVSAGARGGDGKYPKDSINGRVEQRLRRFAEARRSFGRSDDGVRSAD